MRKNVAKLLVLLIVLSFAKLSFAQSRLIKRLEKGQIEKVEKQIRNQPEYYFWTHKRFKHKDKAPEN